MTNRFKEDFFPERDERENDMERGYFGNFGYYNPPYQRETAYNSRMGDPFSTPYGNYTRFTTRDYSRRRASGPHAGRGPRGYQRSDERIREDVNERLTDHPDIDASEIEVRVDNGEVTLIGAVEDRRTKRLAEDVAESVSGVRDVHNQLRIGQAASA